MNLNQHCMPNDLKLMMMLMLDLSQTIEHATLLIRSRFNLNGGMGDIKMIMKVLL